MMDEGLQAGIVFFEYMDTGAGLPLVMRSRPLDKPCKFGPHPPPGPLLPPVTGHLSKNDQQLTTQVIGTPWRTRITGLRFIPTIWIVPQRIISISPSLA